MLNIVLTLFAIPFFLAAFFEFWRNRVTIALLFLFFALALALKIASDFWRTQDACTSGAELYAGDIPDSQQAIDCRKSVGGRTVIVQLGPSLFFVRSPFKHVAVLQLHGHPVLALDRTKRGVLITSDLFDRNGNLLATVRRNKVDFSGRSLSCERPDLNTLSVTTARGQELLFVKFRNPTNIEVRGQFAYPDAAPLRITATRIDRGTTSSALPRFVCGGGSDNNTLLEIWP